VETGARRDDLFLLVQVSDPHLDANDEAPYVSLRTAVAGSVTWPTNRMPSS